MVIESRKVRMIDGFKYERLGVALDKDRYYADLDVVIEHAKKLGYTELAPGWPDYKRLPIEAIKEIFARTDKYESRFRLMKPGTRAFYPKVYITSWHRDIQSLSAIEIVKPEEKKA